MALAPVTRLQREHVSDHVEAATRTLWEQRWPIRYLGWDLDAHGHTVHEASIQSERDTETRYTMSFDEDTGHTSCECPAGLRGLACKHTTLWMVYRGLRSIQPPARDDLDLLAGIPA